ncbi:MAG: thioredoxin domain-containing protein [Candidatus Obscuribacterales bacterium]|nr:thioredoxin domain-containing protein [Candidatus Obscuribacterales bacterium]
MNTNKVRVASLSIPLLLGVLAVRPGETQPVSFNRAVQDYKDGKYSLALSELESYKTAYPNNALVHYYIALCQQSLNHIDRAKAEFEWVAVRSGPYKSMAQTGLQQLSGSHANNTTAAASQGNGPSGAGIITTGLKARKAIDFYTDWCPHCKEFAPAFASMKAKYRQIDFQELNAEDPQNADIVKRYSVNSYPRVVLLSADGKVLFNDTPYYTAPEFEQELLKFQ